MSKLDSWDRNNTIMVGLLRALPEAGLNARATMDSPSVAALFMHVCYVRLCTVCETNSEFARTHLELIPADDQEWLEEHDLERLSQMLDDSAKVVRDAVKGWLKVDVSRLELGYDHPILLLQHLLWHEGYHVGQMKLALKLTGHPMTDQEAGAVTWNIWRQHKP
jgi:uncharacterized damage-inducible protein DinB